MVLIMLNKFIDAVGLELCNIREEIVKDNLIHAFVVVLVIISSIFVYSNDYVTHLRFFQYWPILKILILFSVSIYGVFYFFYLLINREPHPLKCFYCRFKLIWVYRSKLIAAFVLLTSISMFMSSFSTVKSLIPIVNMFKYDLLFQELDSWLFLGEVPALFFHELVESPYIMFFINLCYNVWFFFDVGSGLFFFY